MSDFWKYIITLVVGILLGLFIQSPSCSKEDLDEPRIEYIEVHDTTLITKERILLKTDTDSIILFDTFYIREYDTVYLRDFPIEYKNYRDTIKNDSSSTELDIKYHGFNSDIDSISLITSYYNSKEYIPVQEKKVRWTWCVGPYLGVGGNINLTQPQSIGAGLSAGICVNIGLGGSIK